MPYCGDVEDVVTRISAITDAMIFVAAVWEVAFRFVCTPTGIKPKTAIKQNAATPRAKVTSTSENAALVNCARLMADRSALRRLSEQFELLHDFQRPGLLVTAGPASLVLAGNQFPLYEQFHPHSSMSRCGQRQWDQS
jgi:hypothetical protein